MKKTAIILIGAVAVFALCNKYKVQLCQIFDSFQLENKKFMYAGTLEVTKIILSSRIASNIIYFGAEEGNVVKKGEIVVKLDDEVYQIASKQLNSDYERSLKLVKNGHIATEQHERIERAKKDNDLYLKWCEIRSPLNGTIMTKFKEEGEFVSPGSNIVSIANLSDVWVYFYVEHDLIYQLKIGDTVQCYLSESPENFFPGTIIKINEKAEFTPKNVQTRKERTRLVYGVKVKFNNENQTLKPGMTLETSFSGILSND
ncbi:MAG: efflux RND transporter periplasmic adaptor subunit [Holosporaceae bacterium]|nr:efflux RND transporter periplasmic adaptor subunit [Holosporaceae bacterium]